MSISIHGLLVRVVRRGCVFLLAGFAMAVSAVSFAAETGMVREVYACSYVDGKDKDDLLAAKDYMVKQMDKVGLKPTQTFIWTPWKASVDFDVLWFTNHENLNAFGREADAMLGSGVNDAVEARFAEVVDCGVSALAFRRTIYDGGSFKAPENGPVVIRSSRCTLKHNQGMDQVEDFVSHLKGVLDNTGLHESYLAFMSTPMLGGPGGVDLFLYAVNDSVSSYTERMTEIYTTEAGQMLGRHFNQVMDCDTSLWMGERIISGE